MSHVVQVQTQVRDAAAARAGCQRLGLEEPVVETVKLFSESVTGLAVRLRDWRYPVVFDTATGETKFDNYQGHWGKQERLDEFLQAYAVEKTKIQARRKGYSVSEQSLSDGSIKVTVQVGGAS
ncbi:hypothetical protein [Novipirellula artificiosorum]|uniref:DUF1257 domain-containing protein n=1 Tax=Novipirellula artificiosorum TaxID=2528016 RepID=A0A5C6D8U3_9BACT|nr:hypothetical protein [Novipirellula artificiosorum]TWU33218.1 hypothetical protein Poly41_49700 [Novipirellula artificiosorum]